MANRRQDAAVEQALYQSAVGGVRPVSKLFKLKRVEYDDQTGKKVREYEEIVTGTEEVYDTPSTTAQQFWLKNRLPRQWGGGRTRRRTGWRPALSSCRRQRTAPKAAARPVDKIGHSGIDRLFCRILNKIIHTEKKSSINIQSIMDGKWPERRKTGTHGFVDAAAAAGGLPGPF